MFPFPRWLLPSALAVCCALATFSAGGAAPIEIGGAPVIIVYPFQVGQGVQAQAGTDYALKIADALAQSGGLSVTPNPVAVAQTDFLTNAKKAGADYYLTGFISAVGGSITVIEQLVSVRTGTIVWSNSAQVIGQADVDAAATQLHDVIVAYASGGYYALGLHDNTPPPAPGASRPHGIVATGSGGSSAPRPSPPPAALPIPQGGFATSPPASGNAPVTPNGTGASVAQQPGMPSIGFGDAPVAPTTPPKIYASAAHPSRFAVLKITSKVDEVRDYTANALILALGKAGQTAALGDPDTTMFPIVRGKDICAQTGADFLVWGTSAVSINPNNGPNATGGGGSWATATLGIQAFACKGPGFVRNPSPTTGQAFRWHVAVDNAADAAVRSYLMRLPGATGPS